MAAFCLSRCKRRQLLTISTIVYAFFLPSSVAEMLHSSWPLFRRRRRPWLSRTSRERLRSAAAAAAGCGMLSASRTLIAARTNSNCCISRNWSKTERRQEKYLFDNVSRVIQIIFCELSHWHAAVRKRFYSTHARANVRHKHELDANVNISYGELGPIISLDDLFNVQFLVQYTSYWCRLRV